MIDSQRLLEKWETLRGSILENKQMFPFVHLLGDARLKKQCASMEILETIVLESLQSGNYIRAIKYMAVLRKINEKVFAQKDKIREIITEEMKK